MSRKMTKKAIREVGETVRIYLTLDRIFRPSAEATINATLYLLRNGSREKISEMATEGVMELLALAKIRRRGKR